MRILCVTDFRLKRGYRWVWDFVPGNQDEVTFLNTTVRADHGGWGRRAGYYGQLMRLGWQALGEVKRGNYDLVVAWEAKSGVPLAFLRQCFGQHQPPLVILSFSARGPLRSFRWLERYSVRGADHFSVPSEAEQRIYVEWLKISEERIRHLPLGIHDAFGGAFGKEPGDFVFSGGQSGRDYGTLLSAVAGLEMPVVINAPAYTLRGLRVPANVTVNGLLPTEQYRELNWNARFVVVSLHKVEEAVGLSAILYAMAAGKAVICTDLPVTAEYVRQGETGLLVPAGDVNALREAAIYLWERPEVCKQMGRRAREIYAEQYTFGEFSKRVIEFLHEIKGEA